MRQNTFPKSARLKSRKTLKKLFAEGKNLRVTGLRVAYLPTPPEEGLKCAVGVSARHFKRAVDRNRIKRQIREAYRLQQQDLKQIFDAGSTGLGIFILYTGKEMPLYPQLYANVGLALQKLTTAFNAMATQNT